MPTELDKHLDQTVVALRQSLGENLCSCCLYGSAVRGNFIEGVSDLNLLIVLHESNPVAHQAIADALANHPTVDPFVLTRPGFERSRRAFAPKFQSIRRNYRVLYGEDVLAGSEVDPSLERFLCEQALRNLRLRLAYSFITRARHRSYDRFLVSQTTSIFVQLSAALRLNNIDVPKDFTDRIAVLAREFGIDGSVLRDLIALKARLKGDTRLTEDDLVAWHGRVFPLLDKVVAWVEKHWPA